MNAKNIENSMQLICNLFEACALETSMLKYPPNKSLLSHEPCNTPLSHIAELDFYQRSLMDLDLQDPRFNNMYQEFIETGEISEQGAHYCKQRIDATLGAHWSQFPHMRIEPNNRVRDGRTQFTEPDAWGVSGSVLQAYLVTTQTNCADKATQAVLLGQEILNGINSGNLKNTLDFKITTSCATNFGTWRSSTPLNQELIEMMQQGEITPLDYNALKYAQVDEGIWRIIATTPEPLYTQLQGRLRFGFHSDKSPNILLKDIDSQASQSSTRLKMSSSLINSIVNNSNQIEENSILIDQLIRSIDQAFKFAQRAAAMYFPGDANLRELLIDVETNLSGVRDTWVPTNTDFADQPHSSG